MKKDHSFGFILFFKSDNWWIEYLLINQKSVNGSFWWYPKWHPEDWETPIQAAKRECLEEVWINDIKVVEWLKFDVSYIFPNQTENIEKSVTFFVWEVVEKSVIIQEEELNWYKWADIKTALSILTHKNYQEILISLDKYLNN